MFSDHDGITSEIHSRNIARKSLNIWKLTFSKKKKSVSHKKTKDNTENILN